MSIVLIGSTSGSITLQEPAVAGTTVLDLPATSGTLLTSGSAISASSITTGTLPKAQMPSGSIIGASAYDFTTRASPQNSGTFVTYVSGSFTKSRSNTQLMIMVALSVRGDYNGATTSRFNIGSSTVYGGGKYTATVHMDLVNQIFYVSNNTETGSLSWNYQQENATFNVLNPNSSDDSRILNCTSRVIIFEVMP
jgi:hypothetical protein